MRIIDKCLAKDPKDRYETATDLVADLRQFRRQRRRPRRRILLSGLFAILAIGIAAGLYTAFTTATDAKLSWEITIGRNAEKLLLRDAVPIQGQDDIQIRYEVPRGKMASLFWLDTAGELHLLQGQPVERSGPVASFVWPTEGTGNQMEGPPGSELIFLIGGDDDVVPKRDEVQRAVTTFADGGALDLPPFSLLIFDKDLQQLLTPRGPGPSNRRRPVENGDLAPLRRLAANCDTLMGVAFVRANEPAE